MNTPVPENPVRQDWKAKLPEYWKGLVALFGALLILLNSLVGLNFWGETAENWISTAVAFVTAAAVFLKRNVNAVEKLTGVDIDADRDIGEEASATTAELGGEGQLRADVTPAPPPRPTPKPGAKPKHRGKGT